MSNRSTEKLTLHKQTLKNLQQAELVQLVGGRRGGYRLIPVGSPVSGRSHKFCKSHCVACPL